MNGSSGGRFVHERLDWLSWSALRRGRPVGLRMPLSPKDFADRIDGLFNDSGLGIRRFQNQE